MGNNYGGRDLLRHDMRRGVGGVGITLFYLLYPWDAYTCACVEVEWTGCTVDYDSMLCVALVGASLHTAYIMIWIFKSAFSSSPLAIHTMFR